jgi:hypothetical protein
MTQKYCCRQLFSQEAEHIVSSATVKAEVGAIEALEHSTKGISKARSNPDAMLVNLEADALTFELEADAVTIDSDPDAVTIDPDANAVVAKYEYVMVDAEHQTTCCLVSTGSCQSIVQ